MHLPQNIIRQKRNKQALTVDEIQSFVDGLKTGDFTDAQVGSMAMAIWLNGMTTDEVVSLTMAMRDSGTVVNWENKLNKPIVDKHSTGGVGDKVSLMLAPIVAACGANVPMIAGQGLGHTGGTVDKLEAITGFNVRPGLIEQNLKLRQPMYSESAAYGHMGRTNETVTKTFKSADGKTELSLDVELFTWEKLDFVDGFKNAFNC